VAVALPACGGAGKPSSPRAALFRSLSLLDDAQAVHMTFRTSGRPPIQGNEVTGGAGDFSRPASFRGTFQVSESGLPVSVPLTVVNGNAYLRLPFSSSYIKVDLSKYGFPDPVDFFTPSAGLTAAFAKTAGLYYGGLVRQGAATLWSVKGSLPDAVIAGALQMSRYPTEVKVDYLINPHTKQLVAVSMDGPFFAAHRLTTVTIEFSKYGEKLSIRAPG
jgi:lipoprotein LprG